MERSTEGRKARGHLYTTQTTARTSVSPKFRRTLAPTPIPSELGFKMLSHTIVPNVIDFLPQNRCNVTYPSGAVANAGNILTLNQINEKPNVTWIADFRWFYSLMLRGKSVLLCVKDADEPIEGSSCHTWLIINIPGNDTECGEVILDFGVPKLTKPGLHRFIILVQRQPQKIRRKTLDEEIKERNGIFTLKWFIDDYSLVPSALGNFFIIDHKPPKKHSLKYTRRNFTALFSTQIKSSVPYTVVTAGEESEGSIENTTFNFNYDDLKSFFL